MWTPELRSAAHLDSSDVFYMSELFLILKIVKIAYWLEIHIVQIIIYITMPYVVPQSY